MNALAQSALPAAQPTTVPLLRTLVLCDLVDSTALVGRLGDQRAADLFRKHDRAVRDLLQAHGGREIDKTDGFLAMFDRPIQAVAFALDYQRRLKQLGEDERCPLTARVGIHVGDVLTWDNTPDDVAKGAKTTEVEGLVKPIASRLMQLALPGQILLSGVAYSLAHRAQGELGERLVAVRWRTHGRYQFKGIPDPIPVFEVGEEGRAPLKPPPWSGKAHREIPFWRRPASLSIELALLFALVAVPAWYLFKPAPAIAFANRDWVVVGDLKNLTGESKFDESLQTAFRIGLEQSRYVNVLSDLKTRETIKLMQRDPEGTAIDRAVGSEIAIRDGARALILPTIAEIGGRVRVTAEVIDPNTRTTVYSESADGIGEESVLPSLDKIHQQLRVRLGEALATVSSDSRPLDKVTTNDLDALKAYSLGTRAYAKGQMKEAQALYRQALQLDKEFALAHVGLARMAMSMDQNKEAEQELNLALSFTSRLSSKEKLYVEALLSTYTNPQAALEKWKALTSLYPGSFNGQYAFFLWQSANRVTEALDSVRKALIPQNPYPGTNQLLLGALLLWTNDYDGAIAAFSASRSLGVTTQNEYLAMTYAAKRDYAAAEKVLREGKPLNLQEVDYGSEITRLVMALDRGEVQQARSIVATVKSKLTSEDKENAALFDGIDLSLKLSIDRSEPGAGDFLKKVSVVAQDPREEVLFRMFLGAYLAANSNDLKSAQSVLSDFGSGQHLQRASQISKNMRAVAEAELDRRMGKPGDAVMKLKKLIDGSELCITHVALMNALIDIGDKEAALTEARWLKKSRGRALAEYTPQSIMTPLNAIQMNLAAFWEAELLLKMNKASQAQDALADAKKNWREPISDKNVSQRIREMADPKSE